MTIVVVTGSRSLTFSPARLLIKSTFVELIRGLNPAIVHHGGAIGPDAWASQHFEEIQKVHRPINTDTRIEAIQALFDRNRTMVDDAVDRQGWKNHVVMVACWDGKSSGTRHAFNYAQSQGVPVVFTPVELCEAHVACQMARG